MQTFRAGIFDLDSVVTRTTRLHQKAWRQVFEVYRDLRRRLGKPTFDPYQSEDYALYIDGRTRQEGLKAFLQSRGLDLPEGSVDDKLEQESIWGLGNHKNLLFKEIIATEGIDLYEDSVGRIRQWHEEGLKTALVSSSKNARYILEIMGLQDLFDVCIDGNVLQEQGLRNNPDPEALLAAARELGIPPAETLVVEASLRGIQAARTGGFGMVVGLARHADAAELVEAGADMVVNRLGQLYLNDAPENVPQDLPHALENRAEIAVRLAENPPLLFLDFDGTLAPIVDDPGQARIDSAIQRLLRELVPQVRLVAVISGRDLLDVQDRVDVRYLYYLGSHGFEMSGPGDLIRQQQSALRLLPPLQEAEQEAREGIARIPGARVERKRFAIALHYRQTDEAGAREVIALSRRLAANHPDLKRSGGKKVAELRPDIEWDKGKAIHWLICEAGLRESDFTPIYIGDDLTDEDAYREIRHSGIAIQVGDHGERTSAHYRLNDPQEVRTFLEWLLQFQREFKPSAGRQALGEAPEVRH